MATAHTLPAEAGAPEEGGSGAALERAAQAPADPAPLNAVVARLPVELDVSSPLKNFRVRNLLALEPGRVVESEWNHGEDLPLAAGKVQLAWTEFEVVDTTLAVRITRLA